MALVLACGLSRTKRSEPNKNTHIVRVADLVIGDQHGARKESPHDAHIACIPLAHAAVLLSGVGFKGVVGLVSHRTRSPGSIPRSFR